MKSKPVPAPMAEYIQRLERYLKLIAENPTQEGIQYIPHSGVVAANLAKEALKFYPECGHLPAPAAPAEYTCPRCGSNVSTHICMGEPATENAGKVQASGTHWCLTCGITALGCGHELANRQDDSASAEPVAGETNVTCQHCQTAFYSANTQLAKCPKCKRTLALFHTPSVAGETKYAPLDTKACFNTAAHFEHSWDYRNKTFRCLGKPIAPSVAVPEGEAKPGNAKWRVGRKLGRTLYIGDRFIGSVDTRELASQIVEAVNAGGVSTAGMTVEQFWSEYWSDKRIIYRSQTIQKHAQQFAEAWAAHVLAEKGKR